VAALSGATILALLLSHPSAPEFADRAVAAGNDVPSVPLARAYSWRAINRAIRAVVSRDADLGESARSDGEEAVRIGRLSGARLSELYQYCGNVELILGDMKAAEDAFDRARLGEPKGSDIGVYLAAPAHMLGHHELALEVVQPVLERVERYARLSTWSSYVMLTAVALAGAGQLERARDFLLANIRGSSTTGSIEQVVLGFAVISNLSGDPERASKLLGWVGSRTLDVGRFMASGVGPPLYVHYVSLVREALGSVDARRCRTEGRNMSEDEAIALALEGPDG
jgi:tetratricopeptide (TPR) repeat protein